MFNTTFDNNNHAVGTVATFAAESVEKSIDSGSENSMAMSVSYACTFHC